MIKVYKYGLQPPQDFANDCLAELERMNTFWNRLIEIDRSREEQFRQLCCSYSEEYSQASTRIKALEQPINELYEAIREERIKTQSKDISPELQAHKTILLTERKELWAICKAIQKTIPRELQKPLNEKYKADIKLARQKSGCFWSNYNAVIESFETAKSKAIKDGARLHFKKFDGTGRFVNQIIGGMMADDLVTQSKSQVKFGDLQGNIKKLKAPLTFTAFTGHDENGKHFRRELTALMTYHRPIPRDGIIKSVEVIRHNKSGKMKWHVCFTVSLPDDEIVHPMKNIVGLNLGWRQIGGKLRVAVLVDDKGNINEYFLPTKLLAKFDHAEKLHGQADEAKNTLVDWLREFYHNHNDAHQDWKESAQNVLRAKTTIESLSVLRSVWLSLSHDMDGYKEYNTRFIEFKKLYHSYTGCRRNAVAWREELYKIYAKEIAEKSAYIAITDTPLAKMGRVTDNDGFAVDTLLPDYAKRNRVVAGLYTLKEWIDKQAHKTGSIVEKITDKVTITCNECGHVHAPNIAGSALHYTCENCNAHLEIDINAAINCRKLASGDVMIKLKPTKATRYARVREAMEAKKSSARNNSMDTNPPLG